MSAIKKYLHYFIGQDCEIVSTKTEDYSPVGEQRQLNLLLYRAAQIDLIVVRPYLRSLKEMNYADALELIKLQCLPSYKNVTIQYINKEGIFWRYQQEYQDGIAINTARYDKCYTVFGGLSSAQWDFLISRGYWPEFYPKAFELGHIKKIAS